MDKASAYGAGDCRFESCRGHSCRTLGWPARLQTDLEDRWTRDDVLRTLALTGEGQGPSFLAREGDERGKELIFPTHFAHARAPLRMWSSVGSPSNMESARCPQRATTRTSWLARASHGREREREMEVCALVAVVARTGHGGVSWLRVAPSTHEHRLRPTHDSQRLRRALGGQREATPRGADLEDSARARARAKLREHTRTRAGVARARRGVAPRPPRAGGALGAARRSQGSHGLAPIEAPPPLSPRQKKLPSAGCFPLGAACTSQFFLARREIGEEREGPRGGAGRAQSREQGAAGAKKKTATPPPPPSPCRSFA